MKVDEAREYLDGKQNPGVSYEDWITINNFYSYKIPNKLNNLL